MFADFIKHYDNIRSILREMFLYGCFSREDYENKKIGSSRKVSYEIRRIQQYIEKEFIRIDRDGKVKLLSLSYDAITNTKNFLVSTYLNKSFTKTDIVLHYNILLILNRSDKPLTMNEIEDELVKNNLIDYEIISSKTIERKVKKLSDSMGIIQSKKVGRSKVYSIADDIFLDLTSEELDKLMDIVSLCKNIIFPNISGYYLEDTLKQYMKFERKIDYCFDDIFQYQKLHFHPIIEEEVLWKLLNAIKDKKRVVLEYNKNINSRSRYNSEEIIPYKIRYDVECGRWYLISFKGDKCFISRLDRIADVRILNINYNEDCLEDKYKKAMMYSWSAVQINGNTEPEVFKFKVSISDSSENYIIDKIKAELETYEVEKIDEYTYLFTKIVNDCNELTPWIRGYAGRIEVIEPAYIRKKINRDWKEMLKNYGVIS